MLMWSWDWSCCQTPWHMSPSGSKWAPQPKQLASVKTVCVGGDCLRTTPLINLSLSNHHPRWCFICSVTNILCSSGSTCGFHCEKSAIWRGRRWSLPNTTNWADALSFPSNERNILAVTATCFWNQDTRHRISWTLSQGTLTILSWVRNSIPMNIKFWDGISSDFSWLIIRPSEVINLRVNSLSLINSRRHWFLTSQSSRYGNKIIARTRRCVAMATINRVKTKGLVARPNGSALN